MDDRVFQFTPLREGRLIRMANACIQPISIHAPARGATARKVSPTMLAVFQFTPLREGRPKAGTGRGAYIGFQFTPLREGRPARVNVRCVYYMKFQFTPLREGRHVRYPEARHILNEFQFTPLREGRRGDGRGLHLYRISIHAPARGATDDYDKRDTSPIPFQFTPLREGRRMRGPGW